MQRWSIAGLLAGPFITASPAFSQKAGPVVTFDWPEGLPNSSYSVRNFTERDGIGGPGPRETKKLAALMPDGNFELRVGESSLPFTVTDGQVKVGSNPVMGVQFDAASNTFHFSKVTIRIDGGEFRMPLSVVGASGPLNREPGKIDDVTLVPAKYRFNYTAGNNALLVSPEGTVSVGKSTPGFVTQGNTLRLEPKSLEFEPGPGTPKWQLLRSLNPAGLEAAKFPLLPGDYSVTLLPPGARAINLPFSVNSNFLLAPNPNGPWQEVLELKPENAPTFTISIPNGRAVVQARLERAAADKKALDEFLAKSDQAPWKQDFVFQDYMRFFDFPEQLLSYPVEFPPGRIKASGLALTNLSDGAVHPALFQLTDLKEDNGFLTKATLNLRSDLPKGAERHFRLTYGLPAPAISGEKVTVEKGEAGEVIFKSSRLWVRVPARTGHSMTLNGAPAPMLAVANPEHPDRWMCSGSITAPDSINLDGYSAGPDVVGPLMAREHVHYSVSQGGSYDVYVTLRAGDDFVTIDENVSGLRPENEAYFRFGLDRNFAPDQRQVMSNGGYGLYSGAYDRDLLPTGELPTQLGLNTPNSLGVMRAASFWKKGGDDVLMFAVAHPRDWKTARREVWFDSRTPGNLVFYSKNGSHYLQTRVEGKERHWAMGLASLTKDVPAGYLTDEVGAGPEIRLFQELSDFDLNSYKDWPQDWDEDLTARPDDEPVEPITFEAWLTSSNGPQSKSYRFLPRIPEVFWDYSAEVGPVSFRGMPVLFRTYAASRAQWTPEQRRQARDILLFMAYSTDNDANVPHHSMLGGHPNFIMDVKQTLVLACATFPKYPKSKAWRDSYMAYLDEALKTYQRKPDPEHNALGGRWTENTVCYSFASLTPLLHAAIALQKYDGTDILADPRIHDWITWHRNVMTSPNDGQRLVPPEGAHSDASLPGTPFWKVLFDISDRIKTTAPQLSSEMKWLETNGQEGTKPNLDSMLIADHGPFLRHDFGGVHEAYLHLLQISGRWNYRWGNGDMLYYGAKGKLWSYNGREDNGDEYDVNNLTAFSVAGLGLGRHDSDQILYNFGFAQYYQALSGPEGALAGYKSRGMMLLRDDYLVLHDSVATPATPGQFTWSTAWDFPQIYQLKPGATFTEDTHQQYKGELKGVVTKIRRFKGVGDFLTVVAPTPVEARSTPAGATVSGEQIFLSSTPGKAEQGGALFEGIAGYARPNQLAIFEGNCISLNGFALRRDGGDFGVSAEITGKTVQGRYAGREGGRVSLSLPPTFDLTNSKLLVDGHPVNDIIQGQAITFPVQIAQGDGTRSYSLTFN